MSAWGSSGSARSCDSLLKKVEANDPTVKELVILPIKTFGSTELRRLARALNNNKNTHLVSLQASGHAIDDVGALEDLGKALATSSTSACPALTEVSIGDSKLGDEGIEALCRGFGTGTQLKLKSVDLSWKNIGPRGLRVLLEAIGSQSSMELLNLARNEDIGPSFDFSGYGLPLFPRLRLLDLSGCGLDALTCFSLVTAMTTFGGDLEDHVISRGVLSLNLNATDLRDSEYVSKMMNRLFTFPIVSEMFLSGCQLGDGGLRQMLDACCGSSEGSTIPTMQVLDLSNNNLTQDALQDFFSKLVEIDSRQCHLRQLRKLNLSGNTLDEESCNNLATCIAEGPLEYLCELDVSKTSCGVNGAMALMRSNITDGRSRGLKILNLFGNQLGSEGFFNLSKHLEGGHPVLESLDLGGNEATEAGVVAVLQPLTRQNYTGKKNTLRLLVVGGNQGGPTVETLVKEIQTMHPELDVARDKPGRNQNSNDPIPSSAWTA